MAFPLAPFAGPNEADKLEGAEEALQQEGRVVDVLTRGDTLQREGQLEITLL